MHARYAATDITELYSLAAASRTDKLLSLPSSDSNRRNSDHDPFARDSKKGPLSYAHHRKETLVPCEDSVSYSSHRASYKSLCEENPDKDRKVTSERTLRSVSPNLEKRFDNGHCEVEMKLMNRSEFGASPSDSKIASGIPKFKKYFSTNGLQISKKSKLRYSLDFRSNGGHDGPSSGCKSWKEVRKCQRNEDDRRLVPKFDVSEVAAVEKNPESDSKCDNRLVEEEYVSLAEIDPVLSKNLKRNSKRKKEGNSRCD